MVDFEGIMLNEMSQTQKDKYCMPSLTRGILKRKTALKKEIRCVVTKARREEKT